MSDLYASLFSIAKVLIAEDRPDQTAEVLLHQVLEATGAERGFIVVREGDTYQQRFDVRFEREKVSSQERRFSRSLVRQAIQSKEIIHSPNVLDDARFASIESIRMGEGGAVLVAPLHDRGDVYGALYLEGQKPGFAEEAGRFLREFTEIAALFLRRALERDQLRQRNRALEHDLLSQNRFPGLITCNAKMTALLKMVAQIADSNASVVIRGETGTGKELIAKALHLNSARRDAPLVVLHCSALPGSLIEAELFGHRRGAFTGADRERKGRAASAHGGTLFLDEVAEIPLEVQAKLLRFLQFGEIQRVGSDQTERVDVRVVAATHRDLPRLVGEGKFREDLYFRLKVIELTIPPLRERLGDLPLLLAHYTDQYWKRSGERPRWTARAERALRAHRYPGNVRELAHLVERACLLAQSHELDVDLLPPEVVGTTDADKSGHDSAESIGTQDLNTARTRAVAAVEREFLQNLMTRCRGNVSRAAREAGLTRSYLQKLLSRHHLKLQPMEGSGRVR